ncbi:metallophosphoesterase [Candidatus Woesearchaeota archaeon]|nr:metallophosphoesterase [Candidatus Woesearchaeota archaeon]
MLPPGLRPVGPALLLEQSTTLIIADLHLGAERSMIDAGALLPRAQRDATFTLIKGLMQEATPSRIIINGDLKHDFGRIGEEEWRDVLALLDLLLEQAPVTIILGNHDQLLEPILKKRNLPAERCVHAEGWLITHGDKAPSEEELMKARGVIIGHEHPTLLLDDGVRKERYKCFLHGTYKGKDLIVLPSAYPLVEGTDLLREEPLGPLLKEATKLEAYIMDGDNLLPFGPLDSLDAKLK